MSNSPIIEDKKRKLPEGALLAVIVTILLIAGLIAGFLLIPWGKGETHEQYATGEVYEVTGYIVKADSKHVKGTRGTTLHCDIEIETDQEMPDGTHTYASKYDADFRTIEKYVDKPDAHIVFTMSENGHIRAVRLVGDPDPYENVGNANSSSNTSSSGTDYRQKIQDLRNEHRNQQP